jgi:PAS domain S-box-containing protein
MVELQIATLNGIGQQIVSTPDPSGLLRAYCKGAREIIGAERASIWVVKDDNAEANLYCTSGWDDHGEAKRGMPAISHGIVEKMITKRAPVRLKNPSGDPSVLGLSSEFADIYTFLGGPIISVNHVYGWLLLSGKIGADQFTEHDEELIGLLLAQLSVAYENARLYLEARRHADELNREIAERKLIEEQKARLLLQVQNQKKRLDDIVGTVPGVVWEAWGQPDQTSQRINFVSDYVEEMLGYTVEEWLSTPNFWLTIVHPDDIEVASREGSAIFASRGSGISHFRWMTKDGRSVWIEARCRAICDDLGNPVGLRGISLDISERKRAEAEMLKAHDLAMESLQAKAEFLDNMNHELRTPLNGIVGFAELLVDTELTTEQRDFLERIKESADCLLTRINDVLQLSCIRSGRIELNSAPFSIRQGLEALWEEYANAARRKGVNFTWTISHDLPDELFGDLPRIRQVLGSLIGNAIKFTKLGRIMVEIERDSETEDPTDKVSLLVKVIDTGIGIPHPKRMIIFDAFSQVDGSNTRSYGGMGLGLALCQGLVEMMGGRIWVESEESCGSTFYFTVSLNLQSYLPEDNLPLNDATVNISHIDQFDC